MAHTNERGSVPEWARMKADISNFTSALRRQLPPDEYNKLYAQVEAYCRATRPFAGRPYTAWLGIMQNVWEVALAGKLTGGYFALRGSANTPITGLRAEGVSIDDPQNQETTVKGKKVRVPKTPKPPKKDYSTVGVRFLRGHNIHKVYTYKVAKKAKLRLGEEIVVPSTFEGMTTNGIAVVVEVHSTPQDTAYGIEYKFVTGRVALL